MSPRAQAILSCGIGLPNAEVTGDMNGWRIGTPELVRWGVGLKGVEPLAALIAHALKSNAPEEITARTRALRSLFQNLHFVGGQ